MTTGWSPLGLTFNGTDSGITTWRLSDDSAAPVSDVMSASAKSIVVRLSITGTAPTSVNAFLLALIAGDTAGYTGIFRGNRNAEGDALYAYNFHTTEQVVRMPFNLDSDLIVGLTHDGVNLKGFLNGALIGTTASTATDLMTGQIALGNRSVVTPFLAGLMKHVLFYDRALTESEMGRLTGTEPYAFLIPISRVLYSFPAPQASISQARPSLALTGVGI